MNKKIIIIPIIIVITIFVINFTSEPSAQKTNDIFHITLASPDLYSNGKYTKTFEINKGDYSFRFVPNGSSPKILTISVVGENFNFDEIFELKNTLHLDKTIISTNNSIAPFNPGFLLLKIFKKLISLIFLSLKVKPKCGSTSVISLDNHLLFSFIINKS